MKSTAQLRRRILSRRATIAVMGQGYVGLSVACAAAEVGFAVSGIDTDSARVEDLRAGVLSVPGVNEEAFRKGVETGRLTFTTEAEAVEASDIILICVPTPVRENTPDLSLVEGASKDVARHLRAGSLVVLESTTYPGTTEEIVAPLLETSGLLAGRDFLLAYSPERIDPETVNSSSATRRASSAHSRRNRPASPPCSTRSSWMRCAWCRRAAQRSSRSSSRTPSGM